MKMLARPPWTKKGKTIESACRKALFDYKMLQGEKKLAIALSGGKDSLTLLYMMKAILGHGFPTIPLYAIHINGKFSCGASIHESFLKEICNTLEIPLIIRESKQKNQTLECYSCSRERRRLIFNAAKEVGAHTIGFGHHEDDSNQTLLLNLLHKGEFAGNLPKIKMHDYKVTIIRPLIYVSEQAIYEFAKFYGFARITCQCPVGQRSKRVVVKELIQEMENRFPNVRKNLAIATQKYGSQKAQEK